MKIQTASVKSEALRVDAAYCRRLWIALGGLILGGCLLAAAGCTIDLANQGEVGFRYGTEITFFHRAAKTSDEHAVSDLSVPSIEEWIKGDDADAPQPTPEQPQPSP